MATVPDGPLHGPAWRGAEGDLPEPGQPLRMRIVQRKGAPAALTTTQAEASLLAKGRVGFEAQQANGDFSVVLAPACAARLRPVTAIAVL